MQIFFAKNAKNIDLSTYDVSYYGRCELVFLGLPMHFWDNLGLPMIS